MINNSHIYKKVGREVELIATSIVFTNLALAEEDAASLAPLGRIGVVVVLKSRPVDAAKTKRNKTQHDQSSA